MGPPTVQSSITREIALLLPNRPRRFEWTDAGFEPLVGARERADHPRQAAGEQGVCGEPCVQLGREESSPPSHCSAIGDGGERRRAFDEQGSTWEGCHDAGRPLGVASHGDRLPWTRVRSERAPGLCALWMLLASALGLGAAVAAFTTRRQASVRVRWLLFAPLLVTEGITTLGADRGALLVFRYGIGTLGEPPGSIHLHEREGVSRLPEANGSPEGHDEHPDHEH